MMTGKTNVRAVDGPAVADRNKHQAEDENNMTQKWTVLAQSWSAGSHLPRGTKVNLLVSKGL